ncbi:NAD(P)H pyrophosphatase NUDT13, mitochondrial isoform X1 [Ornithorhynchus anatinus]|uniref:NAD(+) diphosphatase n=1 Tax=Ornithorhynchus anatinus TaxID=9258 RepID=F6WL56_ORNAN|nr:NAD(P)H pyrophosphatase NUDT13, mitochondrial isoform X1 [Ornithorhynchus anatinus]
MALICRATRAACGRTSSPHSRLLLSTYVSKMRYLFDLKEDDRACRQALNSGTFYLFHSLTPLLLKSGNRFVPPPFTLSELERLLGKFAQDPQRIEDSVLIGCSDQQEAQFALDLGLSEGSLERSAVETELQGSFTELRKALFQLEEKDVTLLSTALSLLRWHDNHQFCSKSGHPTKKNVAGSKRVCPSNGIVYYPQVSPVVITLVSDGARCLLVRQSSFPKGLYSALAGFCDVGETLEETVRREVAEEVGLEVQSLRYSASQHWPFPNSSLMIACHVTVNPGQTEVHVNTHELEAARWFSREELTAALGRKPPTAGERDGSIPLWVPPKTAIAHRLICEWVRKQHASSIAA